MQIKLTYIPSSILTIPLTFLVLNEKENHWNGVISNQMHFHKFSLIKACEFNSCNPENKTDCFFSRNTSVAIVKELRSNTRHSVRKY